MESRLNEQTGFNADSLPGPESIDRWAVLRALDRERITEEAPEIGRERLARIVRIRDQIRRGVFETAERLAMGLARAIAEVGGSRRRT